MLRFFTVFLMGCIFWAGPVAAKPDKIHTFVEIEATAEGLRFSYSFSSPVQEFRFDHSTEGDGEQQAIPLRLENWRIIQNDFAFDGLSLKRSDGAAFTQFSMFAAPDADDYDRVYTALFRMDALAYGFYSRHFLGDKEMFDTSFCVLKGDGCSSRIFEGIAKDTVDTGTYILVGDMPSEKVGSLTVVVSPLLPEDAAAQMKASLKKSIPIYEKIFGFSAPKQARVFLSYDEKGAGYVGSVTDGAVIYMQLRGPMAGMEASTLETVKQFVDHEIIHFWNGELFNSEFNAQQAWLHEGSATFFAAQTNSVSSDLDGIAGGWLNKCIAVLQREKRPLNGTEGGIGGEAPYQCGAFIHWVLDRGLTTSSGGKNNVAHVWRDMLHKANDTPEKKFSAAMFEDAVLAQEGGAKSWERIRPILDAVAHARFALLANAVGSIGYQLTQTPEAEYLPFDLISATIFVFLNSECTDGDRGFYLGPDRIKLDTGDRCGVMSGAPIVHTLDGIPIVEKAYEAYQHVNRVCADGGDVTFADVATGTNFSLTCKGTPDPLPTNFSLTRTE